MSLKFKIAIISFFCYIFFMADILVGKSLNGLNGVVEIPADKSISHRAVMFSSLAKGKSLIKNF